MHRASLLDPARWARGIVVTGVVVLGLAGIVGSGGGSGGFVAGDCPPGDNCSAPPAPASVQVEPRFVTALVGTSVSWTATTANVAGNVTYQWSRSSDGGATYVDIPGATGRTLTLPPVNLADDGATVRVSVGASLHAIGHLVVSGTPGVVFQDGEFAAADWATTPFGNADSPAPQHVEQTLATGGNPGAFRKMVTTIAPQSGSGRVTSVSLASTYDPATQGAINVIDYAEDGIALQSSTLMGTYSAMLLEQSGRQYIATTREPLDLLTTHWNAVSSRSSLRARDFSLIAGPACGAAESCPDFSATAAPMRFGYWRDVTGVQGDAIAHGIDNWKVTVWRR